MSLPATSQFTTGGAISNRWYDNRVSGVIKERVTGSGQQPSLTLTQVLPANSRVLMTAMKNPTAVNIYLGSSAAATAGQASPVLIVGTAPTALTTSLTTANWNFIVAQTGLAAAIPKNSVGTNPWAVAAAATNGILLPTTLNTSTFFTATQPISVVPYAATTAANATQRFQVATGTAPTVATTGYTFGTGASDAYSFDVEVFFETFTAPPDN